MQKKITITVPDDIAADLEKVARQEECSEEEVLLNAIKRRIAGSKIHNLEDLKSSEAGEVGIHLKWTS